MSEPEEIPEPWGDEEDEFYDVAYFVSENEGDQLQEYDFWHKSEALRIAAELNEKHGTTRYRAVAVRQRTEWRAVKESDR
jgi:hypothetical protein